MPDSSIFPSLDLEISQLQAQDLQKTGPFPDYGINQSLQNIGDLYTQLSVIKSQNPLLKAKGGMKTDQDFMFPSIKEALNPYKKSSDVGPAVFDPKGENLERYRQSPYYKNLGFVPGEDNEEIYGRAQSGWDAIKNGVVGAWDLAKFQFMDQLKGWGRMADSVFSTDLSKLYDQDDIERANNEMDRISNAHPIFQTQHDRNSIFTFANLANVVQQSGFTLGAISEIAAEEVALSALTAATGGALGELQGVRTGTLISSIGKVLRRLGPVDEALINPTAMRKVFSKITEYTPFTNTLGSFVRGAKAEESTAAFLARGFGGFYRDMRELNAAFTEARAETSGTYTQLKQQLLDELYGSNQQVTQDKLDKIEKTARDAADANFWANSAIISVSNRIEFNNIFRGFKGSAKYLNEIGEIGEDAKGYFQRAGVPFQKGFLRTFRSEILRKPILYFQNNLTEALQENLQNVSNNSLQAYYKANYYNPGTKSMLDSVNEAVKHEWSSTEGAQTFVAGFLTAAITNPFTHGLPALVNRASTSKTERNIRNQHVADTLNTLNGFFTGPEGRNAGINASLSSAMGEAIKNRDQKGFQDLKDESVRQFVRTGIETGKLDSLFDRLESISKSMSKEEFEKAYGIEYSDATKHSSLDYINDLRRRAHQIKDVKDDLDFKYENPFIPSKTSTPEEYAKTMRARNGFEEAKWHLVFMQDAHKRVLDRQTGILRDIQGSLKDVNYAALYTLTDKKRAKDEVKLLRNEAKVVADPKVRAQKERRANLIESIIPSLEAGRVPLKAFTNYINDVQEVDGRTPINRDDIRENHKRLVDFYKLNEDGNKLMDNINWLADPVNFANFVDRHINFEAAEDFMKKATASLDKEFETIRTEHPNYDIKVDQENENVTVTPKPGQQGSDEEAEQIKGKVVGVVNKVVGTEETKPDDTLEKRLADIAEKLAGGQISEQDRDFLNLKSVQDKAKDNPDYIQIQQMLQALPPVAKTVEVTPEPLPDIATQVANAGEDDPDAYPYYETADKTTPPANSKNSADLKGAVTTMSQEVKDQGNDRTENGDVKSEGGYSLIRGQIARLFANAPQLLAGYDFVIVRDSPEFYKHANQMPEDVQKQLGIYDVVKSGSKEVKSPYYFFLKENKTSSAPVIVIKKKSGDFAYFNPNVPGIITNDPKNGVIGAFIIDYNTAGITRGDLIGAIMKEEKQQIILNSDTVSVSPGAYFENGEKLRDLPTFLQGVNTPYELRVVKGLKDVAWVGKPENARNAGVFIKMGNLNKNKLLPAKLSEMKIEGRPYDIRPLFTQKYTAQEAKDVAAALSKIIYTNVFRAANQLPEKIQITPQAEQDGAFSIKLSLLNPTPDTANEPDSRDMQWVDSKQQTPAILDYLLGNRRMNILAEFHQDISVPEITDGKLEFKKVNYEAFVSPNLYTNKARNILPDNSPDIQPVNQYFVFPGLADAVKTTKEKQQEAAEAAGPLTGDKPAPPTVPVLPKITEIPKTEEGPKLNSKTLLDKMKGNNKQKLDDEDFGDALKKLKDGIDRAVIGNKELQFIKDRFGDHVLEQMSYAANSNYWGFWRNGVITLYSNTQKGVGYHEAWHHFSQTFMTMQEKRDVYKEIMETYDLRPSFRMDNPSDLKIIEEHLADKFVEFAQSGGNKDMLPVTPKTRNLFQKIWDFLVHLFTGNKTLNDYFTDLYQGNLESYRPTLNNAFWGRLNYGFAVNEDGKKNEIFDAKEYNRAKGFMHAMLHRAFANDDPEFSLKSRSINMATLLGLRSNKKLKDKALQITFQAVNNQIEKFIEENGAFLDNNPASTSVLDRLISYRKEFFDHIMGTFQIESHVEDVIGQDEPDYQDSNDVKEEDGDNPQQPENMDQEDPAAKEGQYSDKVMEFEDKGMLSNISKAMRNFIRTIPRAQAIYGKDGKISEVREYRNEYGFPEPSDYYKVINVLGEELQGIFEDDKILEKINSDELLQRLPEVKFIREALPDFGTNKDFSIQILISLYRDFNRIYTPVFSHIEMSDDAGKTVEYMKEQTKGTIDTIKREWGDNFINSPSVHTDKNNLRNLDYQFASKNNDLSTIEKRIEYLSNLGIKFSPRTIQTREFRDLVRGVSMDRFADSISQRLANGQPIGSLSDIVRRYYYTDPTGKNVYIPSESQFFNNLARLESLYSDRVPSNMYRTAKGTNKYALMLPNQFSVVGSALKQSNTVGYLNKKHTAYLIDPKNYSIKGSLLLRSLFDDKGIKKTDFIFGDYNSAVLRVFDKSVEKQTVEMTGREKLIVNMKTLFGFGIVDIMRTGTSESAYFWQLPEYHHRYELGPGEKSEIPPVSLLPFNPKELYTKGKPNANFFKAFNGYFFNLAVSELGVMKSGKPGLDKWGIFDGIFSKGLKSDLEKATKDVEPDGIRAAIRPFMDRIIEDTLAYFKDSTDRFLKYADEFGLSADQFAVPEALGDRIKQLGLSWKGIAFLFHLNTFVMNAETLRMVGGTPQDYKEFFKRFKGTTSPGNNMNTGQYVNSKLEATHPNTMAAALGKPYNPNIDEVNTAVSTDDYANLDKDVIDGFKKLGKLLKRDKEMETLLEQYNKKNPVNDGQAKMTLDFYRRFRIQTGNWDFDTDEKEYIKEVNKWRIRKGLYKSEDEKAALQAVVDRFSDQTYSSFGTAKMHYHGPLKEAGVPRTVQHKYAVGVLIPSAIIDTPEDALNDWMLNNDRAYTTAKSGSKVYTPTPFEYWKGDDRSQFNDDIKQAPHTLLAAYLKEQIKIDGSFKKESTWSIQLRSLFLSNMFNDGQSDPKVREIYSAYHDILTKLVDAEREELYNEFGIKEEGDNLRITNAKDFVNTLQDQVDLRNLNSNVKASIGFDEVTGKFINPLEIVTNRQSIVDLVNGMIYRRLVRVKLNGDILVQISSTGTKRSDEQELAFYKPKFDKKGKYIGFEPAQAKIAFNKHFKPLLNLTHPDGKKIKTRERLNEAIKDSGWKSEHMDEISVIANRIPLQEVGSIEHFQIAEFMPEVWGNGIIVSREMTTKAGSDFDNDKLHIIRPTYGKDGKLVNKSTIPVYEKALARLNKLKERNEALSSFIQTIFETSSDENEDEVDMAIDNTPMSDEDRNTIKAYVEAKKDMKGHYSNEVIRSYRDSLNSSPEMFMQLIRPNTDKQVKDLAIDMGYKAGMPGFAKEGVQTFKNTQILEYPSSHITFEQNKTSKKHLAVFAVLNRIMQNFQVTGTRVNPSFLNKYRVFRGGNSSPKENSLDTTMWLLSQKERAALTKDGTFMIGSNKDAEGNIKQLIDSQLMNATVDIEKNPFYTGLGINEYNVGVAAMLLAFNVPLDRISAFLHQPILKEYYKRQAEKPYFKEDFMPTAVRATNRNAVEVLGLKNKKGGPGSREKLEEFIQEKQNNQAKDTDYEKIFSLENLLKYVGRPEWKNREQDIIFAHFLFLQRMQRPYMRTQQVITIDNKKIASPIGAETFKLNVDELRHSGFITNDSLKRLQSESYTSPFSMVEEIKKVFSSMMPVGFSRTFIDHVAERLKEADIFMNKSDTLKLERTLANDYMIYLVLQFGEYKNQNLREYVAKQLSKKVNKDNRLAQRLSEMQKEFPDLFKFYGIASRMHPSGSRVNPNIENVAVTRGTDNSTEVQDAMITELEKLVNFTGKEVPGKQYSPQEVEKIRNFFQDFAVVALGQSGFNKSLFYVTDLLPLDEIMPMVKKAFHEYEKQIKDDPEYETHFIDEFLNDFSKENPQFQMEPSHPPNLEPYRGKYLNRAFKKTEPPVKPKPEFINSTVNITRQEIQSNPDILYLFGDNVIRSGSGGQAGEFRGEPNTIGIITKRHPSNDLGSFLSDTKLEDNKKFISNDINRAITEWDTGKYNKLVVPSLGTGLAKLDTKAPQTFAFLQQELQRLRRHVEGTDNEINDVLNDKDKGC